MAIPDWLDWLSLLLSAAFFVFLPLELWRRRRRGALNAASIREMLASASPFLPTIALGAVTLTFIAALFEAAFAVAPLRIPVTVPTALACLVLVDLLYYVEHRCAHRIRLYWAVSHSVHHSSPQFDQTTALRISFVDGFLSPWFYLPAILLGFHPILVGACFGIVLAYQQWIHTETIGTLGWFDGVFNSPANHRVHHGAQGKYLDKNYGAVLMVWDRLFGTYQAEEEAPRYGLVTPINSTNPIVVHGAELVGLWRDLRRATGWRRRWTMLWRPPGATRPEGGRP
jgi:sterol desaturase/sphingolipid hydroxylase (fatty acid hydroxylase superfamily)